MTEEQKQKVLRNISFLTQEQLWEIIKKGEITFEEMRSTGQLHHAKQEWLRKKIEEEEEKFKEDHALWSECLYYNELWKYEEYKTKFPNGQHINECNAKIVEIRGKIDAEKEYIIRDLKENHHDKTVEYLTKLLNEGKLTKFDLTDNNIITQEELNTLLNPPTVNQETLDWVDLPPLPPNNTDVYFFGIPASGKSCVLAGILKEADTNWKLRMKVDNKDGYQYGHFLMKAVDQGWAPPSTPTDSINFIDCEITSNSGVHPFSFLELSGEYFVRTYNKNFQGEDTLGRDGYLYNENSKAIFFVIDYFNGSKEKVSQQRELWGYILEKLKDEKIFDRTSVVKIILTKSDLMPVHPEDREDFAVQFLKDNYGAFIGNLKTDIEKYGINKAHNYGLHVIPFSLGEFKFGKIFNYDKKSSEDLLQIILEATPTFRKSNFVSTLFGDFRNKNKK